VSNGRLLGDLRRSKGYRTGPSKRPFDREGFVAQFEARVPGHPGGPELAAAVVG
jgi:hypothetical protein